MENWADPAVAIAIRDIVRRLVDFRLSVVFPPPRYGIVQSVNATARTVGVILTGEVTTLTYPVGTAILPVVGDRVRISGQASDRYAEPVSAIQALSLAGTPEVSLAQSGPLLLGAVSGTNLTMDADEIQARNNGAASTLYLNPAGGTLQLGGPVNSYNLSVDADEIQARNNGVASTLYLNPAGGTIQLGAGGTPSQQIKIGDDTYFTDVNVAHTLGLISSTDSTRGSLRLGSQAVIHGLSTYMHLQGWSTMYIDGNVINLRNAAGANFAEFASGRMVLNGQLRFYSGTGPFLGSDGGYITMESRHSSQGGGAAYISGHPIWFRNDGLGVMASIDNSTYRFYGSGYKFTSDWDQDTGLYYYGDGSIALVSNGYAALNVGSTHACINDRQLRLRSHTDPNHALYWWYASAYDVHPSSNTASDGPRLYGNYSVVVGVGIRNYLFTSDGNAWAHGDWYHWSSIRNKKDVRSLDPVDCLDQVKRWRPVAYTNIDDDVPSEGFIAEEMAEVTDSLVGRGGDNGVPSGIAYGKATVHLTGAVQALLVRIEQLETRIAELEAA